MSARVDGFPIRAGFGISQRLATPTSVYRGLYWFAFATAGGFAHRGFARIVAETHAQLATCVVDFSHDQLLSSDRKTPASPGAREGQLEWKAVPAMKH